MVNISDPAIQSLLQGRYIAALATENRDGSIHQTAVWYLFESGSLYVACNSQSRKVRNVRDRPKASLMVDVRNPGFERGLAAAGSADVITGERSRWLNEQIHRRYMSERALEDHRVGRVMAEFDDVTIQLMPSRWHAWDMSALDDAVFGGAMKTPGYLLALD
jgi:PPOX class probable F420-dependent enzyme